MNYLFIGLAIGWIIGDLVTKHKRITYYLVLALLAVQMIIMFANGIK